MKLPDLRSGEKCEPKTGRAEGSAEKGYSTPACPFIGGSGGLGSVAVGIMAESSTLCDGEMADLGPVGLRIVRRRVDLTLLTQLPAYMNQESPIDA